MASNDMEARERRNDTIKNVVLWIPLVIILAIVPLLMRMYTLYFVDEGLADALNGASSTDLYSQVKANVLLPLSGCMALVLFLVMSRSKVKWNKYIQLIMIGAGIFIVISLLSTIFSKNPSVAWWGMPDRAEGMAITMCYILIFIYTIYAYDNSRNFWVFTISLAVLVVVLTILGYFQFIGKDLITNTDFFRKLILTKEAYQSGSTIGSAFNGGVIYGTLMHYNYMGTFCAMLVPFFIILALFYKDIKGKVLFGILTICTLFLLFGSTARSGIIGVIIAALVFLVVCSKKIIKEWKISLISLIAIVAVVVGLEMVTDVQLFRRIPTLLADFKGLFTTSSEQVDPYASIPLKEAKKTENGVSFTLQDGHILNVTAKDNNNLEFTDGNGNIIEPELAIVGFSGEDGLIGYTFTTPEYEKFQVNNAEVVNLEGEDLPPLYSVYYDNMEIFTIMIKDGDVLFSDTFPIKPIEVGSVPSVGFKGKEKLGSSRGYIWARTIPLLKKSMLIGNGPDTFAIYFPQHDYLGKWAAYDTPRIIVDKAHNLYLGMWINNGLGAFIGFLILMFTYLVWSFKLYAFKTDFNNSQVLGVAIMLAVIGYLGAGIFNDSVISVAPIFWVIFGVGVAVNYQNSLQKQAKEKSDSKNKVTLIEKYQPDNE